MPRPDDPAGRVIAGRYRLVRSVGVGGMGRVWLAHDEELACDVALKEIAVPPEVPEHELDARIARARGEARHSARLRSNPHVVTVYDTVVDGGLPWIVMEYVPGAKDLEAVVRESGPLSPDDTAELGLALLDALTAGHQLGILHRDVKPSNVLLTTPESQSPRPAWLGRVLLTDYGISLQQDVGEPRLTTAAGIIGTPGFLAPERARGFEPTPASDLFSLGATLYFAVEGHGPFDRSSAVGTLAALLTEEPTPPLRASNLAPVLLKLLAKDPAHRLRADDAALLLQQLTSEPAQAAQPTITDMPQPVTPPSPPQPAPSRPQTEGSASAAWHQGLERIQPFWNRPRTRTRSSHQQPSRSARRIITLTATGLLVVGFGTWAAVTGLRGQHGSSPRATPTGPVMPYGDTVGLTKELSASDCVTAGWAKKKFKGLPTLGPANCTTEPHDGQVLITAPANSLDDAQKKGDSLCKNLLSSPVNNMADANSYALPPSKQGWENGVHNIACLLFNKTADLAGDAGPFRKPGTEPIFSTNAEIGDCYNNKGDKNGFNQYLTNCDTSHDAQTVGFAKVPAGTTYQAASANAESFCRNQYGSTYATSKNDVTGYYDLTEDSWKSGFHYVLCEVYRPDGQKLTSSVVGSHAGQSDMPASRDQ
ncbi:protein kinase [Streptomyces sp. NPDC001601]|uniref:serine/threonine-protein kinase n=1 Tax=Streptomyces sp. NPDC001601 TaxID=3364592 RepID=UPI003680D4D4